MKSTLFRKWMLLVSFVLPLVGWAQNPHVNSAEYFWDTDPGAGNGVPISALDGAFEEAIETAVFNSSNLPSSGLHKLGIRIQDQSGNWSSVFSSMIILEEAVSELREVEVSLGEYFWDADPGAGAGNPMLAFDGNFDEAIEQVWFSTGTLPSPGNHVLGVRLMGAEATWSPVFSTIVYVDEPTTEQREIKITAAEIFWDSDPGVGSATPMLAFDGNFNAAIEQATYNTGTLPAIGNHLLGIRFRDAENAWSSTFSTIVYVDEVSTAQREIKVTSGEIFWDSDPGAGNATPMLAFDGNFDAAIEQATYNTGTLPAIGNHLLGIRFRDAENTWSPLFKTIVYVDEVFTEQRDINIAAAEIFWDSDPGQGSGIPMLVFDGNFDEAIEQTAYSTTALPSVGNHLLSLRYRDAENTWSPVFSTIVHVYEATTAQRQIKVTLAEMFWDNDPGQGNGIGLAAFDGNFDEAIEQAIYCLAALPSVGTHKLTIRYRDAENQWSPNFSSIIVVDEPITALRNIKITTAEFFWDTDPGEGNATAMLAFDGNLNGALESVVATTGINLPEGPHVLNVRIKDAEGVWSNEFRTVVLIDETNLEQREIYVAIGEYWFDADPGAGNGTPVLAKDGGFDEVLEEIKGGAIPSPVTDGIHTLYLRAKDPQGGWGPKFGIVVDMDTTIASFNTLVSGNTNICSGIEQLNQHYYALAAAGSTYTWSIVGGIILSGQGTNHVVVNWNSGATHTISVHQCLGGPCQDYTLNVNFHSATNTTDEVVICQGESYFAGGAFRTTSGTFVDELQSVYGCDSVVTTILTVLNNVTVNAVADICSGQSIFLGGALRTTPGTYLDTYEAANGCDSLVYTTLYVHPTYSHNFVVEICSGDSYFAGGDYQTTSGFYSDMFQSAFGCDSLVVTQLVVGNSVHTTDYVDICQGQSYFAGGANQSTSGNYLDIIPGVCSEIRTTVLTVHPVYNITQNFTIYTGQFVFAEGEFQTESGTYIDYFQTSFGCDSIVTTNITVIEVPNSVQTIHICEGESFYAGGALQTTSGVYVDVVTGDCTATLTTNLFVHPAYQFVQNVQICNGESYFAGGAEQTTSGTYVDPFQTTAGCDSTYTTVLTVVNSINTSQTIHICEGESYFAGGALQTTSGTYIDEVTNGVCTETQTTYLVVHANVATYSNIEICQGQTYFIGGVFQSEAGVYVDSLQTSWGCDSLITVNLTVTPPYETFDSVSICSGDSILLGGEIQNTPGVYTDLYHSVAGCDSIVHTTLNLLPSFATSEVASICFGDSIFLGGGWQTEAGNYVDYLQSEFGCDSVVTTTLSIVIDLPTPGVINNGDGTATCTIVADSYTWILDGLGCEIITVETTTPVIYLPSYCVAEAFVVNVATIDSNGCQSTYSEPETIIIALCTQANDHCSGAVTLVPDGPILIDSNQCATNSGEEEGSCSPDIGRSVWYKFQVDPVSSYTINLDNVIPVSPQFNPKLEVFSGTCNGLVQLECVNAGGNNQGETLVIEDLLPGVYYYLRVSGFLVQAGSYQISISENASCMGDLDSNGIVNVSDLLLFTGDYSCAGTSCIGDLDNNNVVNVTDLLLLNSVFGLACP